MNEFKNLIIKLFYFMKKKPGLLAVLAFCSGVASYVLVERKESLAQLMAIFLLLSWLWLLIDNWARDRLERRFGVTLSPNIMRFALQMVHQESLFFALPFFLAVTQWDHPQAIFTSLIVFCAFISLVDPLYYKKLALNRTLFSIFHSFALFVVLLVTLPVLFHLTTSQSLSTALLVTIVVTIPSIGIFMANGHWWRFPFIISLLCILSLVVWMLPSFIPPAALRLTAITLSHELDLEQKKPGDSIKELDAAALHRLGLYSWTAVKAPRGLNEKIYHVWLHNQKEVDRIILNISGGRSEGYRAWTHKMNFPSNAEGSWQVKVETESGQLIGLTRFTVLP
ncbi:DUF5924 family protein [Motilimonas sp. 1_MG-2023]|uniref:DUF5924 family protein n=1 Tax=Motilimonas sp. 1_MG-2023 TaxID=3062672 RepID=UPI0026E42A8F|nr:DUF5924 family protein [Motilimonas sp. 1_MG-2023]MDO6526332.1 DUF5924 family protein [Motilimonas sp. 1_MG-2023]